MGNALRVPTLPEQAKNLRAQAGKLDRMAYEAAKDGDTWEAAKWKYRAMEKRKLARAIEAEIRDQ